MAKKAKKKKTKKALWEKLPIRRPKIPINPRNPKYPNLFFIILNLLEMLYNSHFML